ncbi:PEP-CTERM sorting domain-containing protein [Nibricoccus sp. IMCC34717]|uniref:PEP-CTERM sorting domain-containing protein n=1 Tax=Nibricoccus sp. IMCC34717 TaxID=3034021 RepID=UPI00384CBDCD
MKSLKVLLPLFAFLAAIAVPANAAYYYVGSWSLNDPKGPAFGDNAPNGPLAYTGLEAAAFLFGGSASDYAISTVGEDASLIDYMAWYNVLGYDFSGVKFAQDYSNKYLGLYYGPTENFATGVTTNYASALVDDNLNTEINYAFRWRDGQTAVPDAVSTLLVSAASLGLLVAARRRR